MTRAVFLVLLPLALLTTGVMLALGELFFASGPTAPDQAMRLLFVAELMIIAGVLLFVIFRKWRRDHPEDPPEPPFTNG